MTHYEPGALIAGQDRRRETARQNARLQAQLTLERLTQGIAALAKVGMPITAKPVEAQTGLSYRTITRNADAYVLFCKHAVHFQPKPPTRTTHATRRVVRSAPSRRRQPGIRFMAVRNDSSRTDCVPPSSA